MNSAILEVYYTPTLKTCPISLSTNNWYKKECEKMYENYCVVDIKNVLHNFFVEEKAESTKVNHPKKTTKQSTQKALKKIEKKQKKNILPVDSLIDYQKWESIIDFEGNEFNEEIVKKLQMKYEKLSKSIRKRLKIHD